MKVSVSALLILAALVGCESNNDLAAQRVEQLMTIWESGDVSNLDQIVSDDVVYDDVPNGIRFEGSEGLRQYVNHVHSWAGQVDIEIMAIHHGPDAAVAEWRMTGVQEGPIPGRIPVATQRPFELSGSTLIELRDGRIVRAADYLDTLGFVLQLGARVALPSGVVFPPPQRASSAADDPEG